MVSENPTDKEKAYFKMIDDAKPLSNVQKYSLDLGRMKTMYGLNDYTYQYQRCRVAADRRYSVAYGVIPVKTKNRWFYWYDEVIVTLKGNGRFTTRTRPTFDKEEKFDVKEDDIFFVGKGTDLLWENTGSDPWIYMIVAIPAAAKD